MKQYRHDTYTRTSMHHHYKTVGGYVYTILFSMGVSYLLPWDHGLIAYSIGKS